MFWKLILRLIILIAPISVVSAVTNIDPLDKWAWSDSIGWIDFYETHNTQNEVVVTSARIEGSAVITASGDYFSLDCATSPNPAPNEDICADSFNYFVSNDSNGNLAGWAWSDSIGWVSFCGNTTAGSRHDGTTWVCPVLPTYQVKIIDVGTSRDFSGYAWNDAVGWIDFNTGTGFGANIKVKTYWGSIGTPQSGNLTSNTIDTCPSGDPSCASGVAYNYILWRGALNGASNSIKFQLATSNCKNGADTTQGQICDNTDNPVNIYWGNVTGDGAFLGPGGTSSDTDKYTNPLGPNTPIVINNIYHNNKRYYRYKVFIEKAASNPSPVINDVIINWSL